MAGSAYWSVQKQEQEQELPKINSSVNRSLMNFGICTLWMPIEAPRPAKREGVVGAIFLPSDLLP